MDCPSSLWKIPYLPNSTRAAALFCKPLYPQRLGQSLSCSSRSKIRGGVNEQMNEAVLGSRAGECAVERATEATALRPWVTLSTTIPAEVSRSYRSGELRQKNGFICFLWDTTASIGTPHLGGDTLSALTASVHRAEHTRLLTRKIVQAKGWDTGQRRGDGETGEAWQRRKGSQERLASSSTQRGVG